MRIGLFLHWGLYSVPAGQWRDGTFPPHAVERLHAIGAWMDVYGDAIYGTTGSPFGEQPWHRCTAKSRGADRTLYLGVFDWPTNGTLDVPQGAVYVIRLSSDDGSRLLVDGHVVVENDGLHRPRERAGAAPLARGSRLPPPPPCAILSTSCRARAPAREEVS